MLTWKITMWLWNKSYYFTKLISEVFFVGVIMNFEVMSLSVCVCVCVCVFVCVRVCGMTETVVKSQCAKCVRGNWIGLNMIMWQNDDPNRARHSISHFKIKLSILLLRFWPKEDVSILSSFYYNESILGPGIRSQ